VVKHAELVLAAAVARRFALLARPLPLDRWPWLGRPQARGQPLRQDGADPGAAPSSRLWVMADTRRRGTEAEINCVGLGTEAKINCVELGTERERWRRSREDGDRLSRSRERWDRFCVS
jgi:hypothetical protein